MTGQNTIPSKLDYQPASISGKSVVVTGGTTGSGRATALLLASTGARVLIFGRHEKELQDAMNDMKDVGEVYGLTADQARHEDVQRVFQEADRALGGVDILINNAALPAESIVQTEYQDWEYIMRANLVGYMDCSRQAIERMKKKGEGHIINIGSISAEVRDKGSDIYTATKAGIQGFTESLRKQVNEMGIKVTLIEPGLFGSDLIDMPVEEQRKKQQSMEMLKAEDIAECIYYCLTQPKRCEVITVQLRPHRQSEDI